jgi:hypothetical protein
MAASGRLKIWWEVLARPTWTWAVTAPLFILGAFSYVRDEFLSADTAARYKLPSLLPAIAWYWWALLFLVAVICILLESGYRIVRKRETIILEIAAIEATLTQMSKLHAEGRRLYNDTASPIPTYVNNLENWEARVAQVIQEKFSAAELHFFRSYGSGVTYMIPGAPQEWLVTTLQTRMLYTARIGALNQVIQNGGNHFLGPKMKLAEMLERE